MGWSASRHPLRNGVTNRAAASCSVTMSQQDGLSVFPTYLYAYFKRKPCFKKAGFNPESVIKEERGGGGGGGLSFTILIRNKS